MSLFRSRKKSFNDGEAATRRPSMDEAPPMPSGGLGKYSFRRKKTQPEVKKEIDLATALPSTDDFRTSLLMPNLSARFSMLREQDDPNTKLGKASDDSVLFPKRISRLNLFATGDLADIAEVTSLSGSSIRPPFATERSSTYSAGDAGGYTTDEDGRSVMTRARPGQGNKFFGGRQKVYMLSTRDGEAAAPTARRTKGRAVYDDDINIASFNSTYESQQAIEDTDAESNEDYNSKRQTSSSTNSGPFEGRMSTAATSVASGAPSPAAANSGFVNKLNSFSTASADRPAKGKRLYGQALEQQMYEQQSSAMNRLNSIQRNFATAPTSQNGLISPVMRSASLLSSSSVLPPPLSISNSRNASEEAAKNSAPGFDFGIAALSPEETSSQPRSSLSSSIRSPMGSSMDPTLVAALDANDIGKATATGAFNKPAGPYSDEQYAKRQLQLQQDRAASQQSSNNSRPGTGNKDDGKDSRESSTSLSSQKSDFSWQSAQAHRQPSIREQSSHSQLRDCNTPNTVQQAASDGIFLANTSGSEYGSEPASPSGLVSQTVVQTTFTAGTLDPALRHRKYEHDDQHPAFNTHADFSDDVPSPESTPDLPLQSEHILVVPSLERLESMDEPITQEITHQGGLADLVRGHLRNISNQSSVYPDSPRHPDFQLGSLEPPTSTTTTDADPPVDSLASRARLLLENATQLRNASTKPHDVLGGVSVDKVQQILGGEAPRRSNESTKVPEMPWQEQMRSHNRQASTETQREREDFANELADRRKQVQDSLRNLVSSEGQSVMRRVNEFDALRSRSGSRTDTYLTKVTNLEDEKHQRHPQVSSRNHPNRNATVPFYGAPVSTSGPISNSHQYQPRHALDVSRSGIEHSPPSTKSSIHTGHSSPTPQGEGSQALGQHHPSGRPRKYSPPNMLRKDDHERLPYQQRSPSAQGRRSPALRNAPPPSNPYFPPTAMPNQTSVFHDASNTSSPARPAFTNNIISSPESTPYMKDTFTRSEVSPARKGSINKSEISSPTFLNGTSSMLTMASPQSASHGVENGTNAAAPPLPPINPRRQRLGFFSAVGNRSANNLTSLSTPSSTVTTPGERTAFLSPDPRDPRAHYPDDTEKQPFFRNRLRKSSSAGENMSQKAKYQALRETERLPESPKVSTMTPGMF